MIRADEEIQCESCGRGLEGCADEGACPGCGRLYSAWVIRQRPVNRTRLIERCGECGYPLEGLPPAGQCPECDAAYQRIGDADHWPTFDGLCPRCRRDLGALPEQGECPACGTGYRRCASVASMPRRPRIPIGVLVAGPALIAAGLSIGFAFQSELGVVLLLGGVVTWPIAALSELLDRVQRPGQPLREREHGALAAIRVLCMVGGMGFALLLVGLLVLMIIAD